MNPDAVVWFDEFRQTLDTQNADCDARTPALTLWVTPETNTILDTAHATSSGSQLLGKEDTEEQVCF